MVKIQVSNSIKCGCEKSIFVSFPYDINLVNLVKSFPVRFWHSDIKKWELPYSSLQKLQCRLNDDNYDLTNDFENSNFILPSGFSFKTKPFKHQIEGIQYGMQFNTWLLGDEQGTGKSKTVIDLAAIKKLEFGYKHCLIICGVNSLKWNWVKEINTHSNEKAWVLGQREKAGKIDVASNQAKLDDVINIDTNDSYFLVTNIETLRNSVIVDELVKCCKSGKIDMIALDEAHSVRNPSSQQAKGLLKLLPNCRIAMTGTPLMNSPLDLYPILKWLGYENHNFYAFKTHYCVMGGYGNYQIVGYKNLSELQDTLDSIMLRRLKSDVLDLPDKLYVDELIEMTPKQSIVYKEVLLDIKNNIDKIISSSVNPLSALIRLRQATGNTEILSTKIKESAKYDRMLEIVEEAVQNNKKVIIFSNWVKVIEPAFKLLSKQYKGLIITGETKDNDRQKYIDEFQNNTDYKFICGTIGAMGTGVTLTEASVEIFLDEPWTKAAKEQAVDRAYRIGTNENITIYTLLCKDTIDCKVNDIVNRKGYMSDAIIDGTIRGDKLETLNYLLS